MQPSFVRQRGLGKTYVSGIGLLQSLFSNSRRLSATQGPTTDPAAKQWRVGRDVNRAALTWADRGDSDW